MLKDFHLIHRPKPHASPLPGPLVWETCLRSIAVTKQPDVLTRADQSYSDREAYRFLLEVICGLHSPVLGETEVFGQFKAFSKVWLEMEPNRATLIQRLFAEAKEIRSKHLLNLGTQSYGSWLKRMVMTRRIHILGGGELAREISPYLLKVADSVTVHVRNPLKVNIPGVHVRALSDHAFNGGGLIVAAPMAATEIDGWLKDWPFEVFDLRDTSQSDPLSTYSNRRHVLNDVFNEIERTKATLKPIITAVKSEILERSEKTAHQVHVRPQGWDDLCA